MTPEPVTRLRSVQVGTDPYQNPIYDDVESDLPPALFAPGGAAEPVETGRAPVVSEPTLYWRHERPDVHEGDRVRVRGLVYAVDGPPADWRGSNVGGLAVALRRDGEVDRGEG